MSLSLTSLWHVSVWLMLACTDGGGPSTTPDGGTDMGTDSGTTTQTTGTVDPVDQLTRLSLDLRGVRPSIAEIEAVEADAAQVEVYAASFLAGDAFGERYVDLLGGVWATEVVEFDHDDAAYPVDDPIAMLQALGMEPLMMLQHIADEDLPYTDLVTADWTVIDESLAAMYPTDYPADGTGWQVARYTDDRPQAGVLTSNGFYWRYQATLGNANRGRANQVSRILLCWDYLDIAIEGDRDLDLLDDDAVQDALRTSEACVACHNSLDPLAAYFWGFYNHFEFSPAEQSAYHHDRELWWKQYGGGVGPGYYGQPGSTLTDLGLQIAADSRYPQCAVQRTFEQLLQRPATLDDTDSLSSHREVFLAQGLTLRSLVGSVISDPRYLPLPTDDESKNPWKVLSVKQYASSVQELTGYRFTHDDYDVLGTDLFGMRTMGGGLGVAHDQEQHLGASPTQALVLERMGWAAADWVVGQELASPETALLLPGLDLDWRTDDAVGEQAMAELCQRLYLRILGQRVALDSDDVARLLALWNDVYDVSGDPQLAWTAVVSHMLRHPDFFLY